MGLDYHFHLQTRHSGDWSTPVEFTDPDDRVMYGELTWFDDKDVSVLRLFVRDDAMFPLRKTQPPDFDISKLYKMSNRTPVMTDSDVLSHIHEIHSASYVGWIGFDDLCVDLWHETELLVQKSVPIGMADAFGDGNNKFPREQLLASGWPENEFSDFENTSHYARDKQFDPNGYTLTTEPKIKRFPDSKNRGGLALVTWRTTIAQFIGEWRMNKFDAARSLAGDQDLRLICTFS